MTTSAVTPHFISENCLFPQPEHAGGVEHGRPRLAQRRTPQPALLTAQARFGGCGNFLQIKSLVEEVAGDIMGIGPMAIYDTGLYIGANLGLLPEEVWMHAGAREGALENGASCRARLLPLSAFAQGKFWEMHDTLFARQDALDDADLLKYAAELSLDSDRVSRELARHEYARRVEEDQQSGPRQRRQRHSDLLHRWHPVRRFRRAPRHARRDPAVAPRSRAWRQSGHQPKNSPRQMAPCAADRGPARRSIMTDNRHQLEKDSSSSEGVREQVAEFQRFAGQPTF